MKHAYFLATEALAGLLCNARLDHTYRPLPGRALEKAGEVRDADGAVTAIECSGGRVDVVAPSPRAGNFIPLNRVDWISDAGDGQNGVSHSVFSAENLDGAEGCEHEAEGGHGSSPCSCGGETGNRAVGQPWPDAAPVVWEQLLARCNFSLLADDSEPDQFVVRNAVGLFPPRNGWRLDIGKFGYREGSAQGFNEFGVRHRCLLLGIPYIQSIGIPSFILLRIA